MDVGFDILKKRISSDRGFNCEHYKEKSLKRRIAIRMRDLDIKSYTRYANFLKDHEKEYDKLLDVLTVNVSKFFRDISAFKAFQSKVLPELIKNKKEQNRGMIRIWSAGCATGEEPYSIAVILKEFLSYKIRNFLVSITATNIDEKCLEKAKIGCYGIEQLGNLKKELLEEYFEKKGKKYLIKKEIKDLVRFIKHDLISHKPLPYFDVIFCRNVLIYFTREIQKEIFENFYSSLNKNGYLIIGKTETLTENVKGKFEVVDLGGEDF